MTSCQSRMSGPGRFIGSSNVYLSMKYDLLPVGTMAHEFIAAIGGMFGPQMANLSGHESLVVDIQGRSRHISL